MKTAQDTNRLGNCDSFESTVEQVVALLDDAASLAERDRLEAIYVDALSRVNCDDSMSNALHRNVRSLAEILSDPGTLELPNPVVPRMVLPGRTTMLAAHEKDGKSTTASAMAASVSNGSDFLDGKCRPGEVVWLLLEEHPGDLARRLFEFGANSDLVFISEHPIDALVALETAVREIRPSLTVVDTLAGLSVGIVRDAFSSTEWTPLMLRLARLAQETDTGILLLHHSRKSDGRYRDSSAIGAGVDILLEMHREESDPYLRQIQGRARIPISDFSIRYTGSGFELFDSDLSIESKVLQHIRINPSCSKSEIRRAVSGSNPQKDKALLSLLDQGIIENIGSQSGHKYRCPPEDDGAGSGQPLERRQESHPAALGQGEGNQQGREGLPPLELVGGNPTSQGATTEAATDE